MIMAATLSATGLAAAMMIKEAPKDDGGI